jgi:hypothetical protein
MLYVAVVRQHWPAHAYMINNNNDVTDELLCPDMLLLAAAAAGSGLAFMATALLSCRSITTKAIAHTYQEPSPSIYMRSSLPG